MHACVHASRQNRNITGEQYKAMADQMKALGWEIEADPPAVGQAASAGKQLARLEGPPSDEHWGRVSQIIVYMEKLDKEATKMYNSLSAINNISDVGKRLLVDLEDGVVFKPRYVLRIACNVLSSCLAKQ